MFCNGTKKLTYFLMILLIISSLVFALVTQYNFIKLIYLTINDSLGSLSIISSPVYTWVVLLIVLIYYMTIFKTITSFIITSMLIIILYFVSGTVTYNLPSSIIQISSISLNLQNGLLNIHPYIIYVLYGYIIILTTISCFNDKSYSHTSNNINYTNLLLISVGILLGAWWASQELNWGGLWSWDPVELISLITLFYIGYLSHSVSNMFKRTPLVHYMLVMVLIYVIMRLGVVSTIHSFIKNNSFPFFFYIVITFLLLLTLHKYNVLVFKTLNKMSSKIFSIALFLVISFLMLLVLNSVNLLTNMFLFKLNYIYMLVFYIYLVYKQITKLNFNINELYYTVIVVLGITCIYFHVWPLILVLVFVIYQYKFRWNFIHIFLLYLGVVLTLFFVFIPKYNSAVLLDIKNIQLTSLYTSNFTNFFFESNVFLKKHFFINSFKNNIQHLLTFDTYFNIIQTYFMNCKNYIKYIFYTEEYTQIVIYLLIVGFFYSTPTYIRVKYMNVY